MAFETLTPMLRTHDLQGTVSFYTEVLGFTCEAFDGGWASLRRDNAAIMLALPNAHEPFNEPNFTGSLYFSVDDVDELWESVREKTEIVYPVENFPYGMREFALRDNNGYLLQFGQDIQSISSQA